MDNFLHDPRRVMVAAYNRLLKAQSAGPVRETQIRLLASSIAAMDRMSPELATLHEVYRMALVILGKEEQRRVSSEQRSILHRLERAYDLAR